MEKPIITKEKVKPLLNTPYLSVYDLQYAEDKHYFDASRRKQDDLIASMTDDEFSKLIPDAVSICVILKIGDEEKILTFYEYRYPVGRFLLSPPAGLIDPEDKENEECFKTAAVRELFEETGIVFNEETDRFQVINPGLFSSPGMTDESNAVVLLVLDNPDLSNMGDSNTTGTELFQEICLLNKEEAKSILKNGKDHYGNMFSVYTWVCLMYFVSDIWK